MEQFGATCADFLGLSLTHPIWFNLFPAFQNSPRPSRLHWRVENAALLRMRVRSGFGHISRVQYSTRSTSTLREYRSRDGRHDIENPLCLQLLRSSNVRWAECLPSAAWSALVCRTKILSQSLDNFSLKM